MQVNHLLPVVQACVLADRTASTLHVLTELSGRRWQHVAADFRYHWALQLPNCSSLLHNPPLAQSAIEQHKEAQQHKEVQQWQRGVARAEQQVSGKPACIRGCSMPIAAHMQLQ